MLGDEKNIYYYYFWEKDSILYASFVFLKLNLAEKNEVIIFRTLNFKYYYVGRDQKGHILVRERQSTGSGRVQPAVLSKVLGCVRSGSLHHFSGVVQWIPFLGAFRLFLHLFDPEEGWS